MSVKKLVVLASMIAVLAGCATKPQEPVAFNIATATKDNGKIGVVMSALPKVDTQFPGAYCLLCLAAASVANSTLTTYTQTLSSEDVPGLREMMATSLRKKGAEVVLIPDFIKLEDIPKLSTSGENISRLDFSSYKNKYGVDKLVVINVTSIGFRRNYASYVPTSDPKAVFEGVGFMVNLKDHKYEWYLPVTILKSAEGSWDEAPKFPSLTNAYFQAIEFGKDSFVQPLNQ